MNLNFNVKSMKLIIYDNENITIEIKYKIFS